MNRYHLTSLEGPLGVLTWDSQCQFEPDEDIDDFLLREMQRGIERLNHSRNGRAHYRVVPKQPFSIAYNSVAIGDDITIEMAHRVFSNLYHMSLSVSEVD